MADRRHTLRRFPVLATTSAEEAHDAVTDVYLPHALRAETALRMELNAARQKRFTLGFLAYGAKAELRMPATETTYHINLTTSGRTFAERGDGTRAVTQARRSGVVLLPDQLNTVRWTPDAEQLILKIPRTRLESHLADLVGHPVAGPIDFDFGFSTQSPRGRSLLASVEFLARELDRDGGIGETPLAQEHLEAFVMTQVLLAVRNSYTDVLAGYVTRARPSRLSRCWATWRTMPTSRSRPASSLAAECMSVRALHAIFPRTSWACRRWPTCAGSGWTVSTPSCCAAPGPVRISDVAARWGFFPQQVRAPVPGAVRRAALGHRPPAQLLTCSSGPPPPPAAPRPWARRRRPRPAARRRCRRWGRPVRAPSSSPRRRPAADRR